MHRGILEIRPPKRACPLEAATYRLGLTVEQSFGERRGGGEGELFRRKET